MAQTKVRSGSYAATVQNACVDSLHPQFCSAHIHTQGQQCPTTHCSDLRHRHALRPNPLPCLQAVADKAHAAKAQVVAATDLLALTVIQPPSTWGADICVGSAQRFGVPMGYGGPHAAFLACATEQKRLLPGRIIGAPCRMLAGMLLCDVGG